MNDQTMVMTSSSSRSILPGYEEFLCVPAKLPFGPAPRSLVEAESEAAPFEDKFRDRVLALVANAVEAADSAPSSAATCLHEAGRILDRIGGLPAEAWFCHSRALSFNSELKPASDALRRLARRAGDREQLLRVIETQFDWKQSPVETACLHVEKAALKLVSGESQDALESLREAVRADSSSIVAHLLRLPLSSTEGDHVELLESLRKIADAWPSKGVAGVMYLVSGLIDEQIGRVDEAVKGLTGEELDDQIAAASLFARARVLFREGQSIDAAKALEELVLRLGDTVVSGGFDRCRKALEVLCSEEGGLAVVLAEEGTAKDHWDLSVVNAARMDDHYSEIEAVTDAINYVESDELNEMFRRNAAIASAGMDSLDHDFTDAADLDEVDENEPLAVFLNPGQLESAEVNRSLDDQMKVSLIHTALKSAEASEVDRALADLEAFVSDGSDTWDVRVARAVSARSILGNPKEAIRLLKESTSSFDRVPMPSLLRLHARDSKTLAELASAEADCTDDESQRAILMTWAAGHLASFDHEASMSANRVALDLDPDCLAALSQLRRSETRHDVIGAAFEMAALNDPTSGDYRQNLAEAGVQYLLDGNREKAFSLLATVSRLDPGDLELFDVVKRLALGHEGKIDDLLLARLRDEPGQGGGMDKAGVLLLEDDPSGAAKWFERTAEEASTDPFVRRGLIESRLRSGRCTLESGRLLDALKEAETIAEEALIYLRMSEIDSKFGGDMASSMLTLMAVSERIPGNRSVLGRLALYFMHQGRNAEMVDVFRKLATVLEDDRDAVSFAKVVWQESVGDIESVRVSARRDPDSVLGLAQLEARTDSQEERAKCLLAITELMSDSEIFQSRLGDAMERNGELAEALKMRACLLEADPQNLYELFAVERIQRQLSDHEGLINTLVRQSEVTLDPSFSNDRKLEAAQIADAQLGDARRGALLCLEILEMSARNDQAFTLGRMLADKIEDLNIADKLLTARRSGADDPAAEREILLDQVDTRLSRGDAVGARESLLSVLEQFPQDMGSRRKLVSLYKEDQLWNEAIEHQLEVAKLVKEPAIGVEVFFELGVLYMDHSDQKELAEKSFVKVLGWKRDHFEAMERIGDLYLSVGNWGRGAQALEHQVALAKSETVKLQKMIDLAGVLDTRLDRSKEAESILNDVRRADPRDIQPIKALAAMYTRQHDAMALNVLLDQSLLLQSEACQENPGNSETYRNILDILSMKAQDGTASMAAAILQMTGGALGEEHGSYDRESGWDVGARVAEKYVDDYIYPKTVPAGLRETLKAVEEPVAKLLGATAKQVASGRRRIDKKHPLSEELAGYSSAFGIRGTPVAYVGEKSEIYVAPGSPPAVLVPASLLESRDAAVFRFVAVAALTLARQGLSLVTILSGERMRRLLAGLVKLSVPGIKTPGFQDAEIKSETETLKQAIPQKIQTHIQPFAFDCNGALEDGRLSDNVLSVGHRVGFMAAGSLTGAVNALRALAGVGVDVNLDMVPGSGGLLAFVFSKDHLELRKKLGL